MTDTDNSRHHSPVGVCVSKVALPQHAEDMLPSRTRRQHESCSTQHAARTVCAAIDADAVLLPSIEAATATCALAQPPPPPPPHRSILFRYSIGTTYS
ncbi:hypothetical protein J6590_091737 [Homalodisca vitripennis]|nr:hypothetical protein J6590_091737 [Homalodisca vitripennis]